MNIFFDGTLEGLSKRQAKNEVRPDETKKTNKEKYKEDIEALQEHYGEAFKTGLFIKINLQELLRLCPRERCRIDAYRGLVSYLEKSWGIVLKIISQKTKEDKNSVNN